MRLEQIMCPTRNKLILVDETLTTKIVDAELDCFDCEFDNDGCIVVDTSKATYVTLSIENLEDMIRLISKAEKKYTKIFTP